MNTLNYELPLIEEILSPSSVTADRFQPSDGEPVYARAVVSGYNDQTEFIEIDPFTGRIRTIRHH